MVPSCWKCGGCECDISPLYFNWLILELEDHIRGRLNIWKQVALYLGVSLFPRMTSASITSYGCHPWSPGIFHFCTVDSGVLVPGWEVVQKYTFCRGRYLYARTQDPETFQDIERLGEVVQKCKAKKKIVIILAREIPPKRTVVLLKPGEGELSIGKGALVIFLYNSHIMLFFLLSFHAHWCVGRKNLGFGEEVFHHQLSRGTGEQNVWPYCNVCFPFCTASLVLSIFPSCIVITVSYCPSHQRFVSR